MQHRTHLTARRLPTVWCVFNQFLLPRWDLDCITRVLCKSRMRVRHERMGGGYLCPLDDSVEDHLNVLKQCLFLAFMFDTVRKAFGLAQGEG